MGVFDNFLNFVEITTDKIQYELNIIFGNLYQKRQIHLKEYTDLEIGLAFTIGLIVLIWLYLGWKAWYQIQVQRGRFGLASYQPFSGSRSRKQISETVGNFRKNLHHAPNPPIKSQPTEGWKRKNILKRIEDFSASELQARASGKYSGDLFTTREDLMEIASEASKKFLYTNMSDYSKSVASRQLENEIVSFTKDLLQGSNRITGFITSDNSESIYLALLAHKNYYFKLKGVNAPEIVIPETAHPAFERIAIALEIKPIIVKVSKANPALSEKDFARKITSSTICIVGSCPNQCYGLIDPIDSLSKLAGKYDTGLFIDASLGSFLLPFMGLEEITKTSKQIPKGLEINLSIKNMTAFICDTQGYGMAPRGCSLLFYGNKDLHLASNYFQSEWIGGVYSANRLVEEKNTSAIAATWSVMMQLGYNGYFDLAKKVFDATENLVQLLKGLEKNVKVVGQYHIGCIALVSNNSKLHIQKLALLMNKNKDWKLDIGSESIRLIIHDQNAHLMTNFVEDLELSIQELLENGAEVKNLSIIDIQKNSLEGVNALMNGSSIDSKKLAMSECLIELCNIKNLQHSTAKNSTEENHHKTKQTGAKKFTKK